MQNQHYNLNNGMDNNIPVSGGIAGSLIAVMFAVSSFVNLDILFKGMACFGALVAAGTTTYLNYLNIKEKRAKKKSNLEKVD